jgi:hypothetical protein
MDGHQLRDFYRYLAKRAKTDPKSSKDVATVYDDTLMQMKDASNPPPPGNDAVQIRENLIEALHQPQKK